MIASEIKEKTLKSIENNINDYSKDWVERWNAKTLFIEAMVLTQTAEKLA